MACSHKFESSAGSDDATAERGGLRGGHGCYGRGGHAVGSICRSAHPTRRPCNTSSLSASYVIQMFHRAAFSGVRRVPFHRAAFLSSLWMGFRVSSDMHACSARIAQVVSVENFFKLELTLAKEQILTLDAEVHAQTHLLANTTQVRLRVSSLMLES